MDFSPEMLASRVRRFRYNKKLSIEQLAQKAKVDKNTIVRIEKGEGRPNLKTLINICNALGESVDKLIDMNAHENKDFYVHRREKTSAKVRKSTGQKGLRLGDLVAKLPFGLINAVILEIDGEGKMRSHSGEEILFCLKGKVGVNIGNTSVILKKGDSVMIFGREPHQYFNADKSNKPVTAVGFSVWLDDDIDLQSDYFESYHL